jgi:hypothetical protein
MHCKKFDIPPWFCVRFIPIKKCLWPEADSNEGILVISYFLIVIRQLKVLQK